METMVVLYGEVTWESWCLESPANRLFIQQFVKADIKENIKACVTRPFWWESTSARWIPGQYLGKRFKSWRHHKSYTFRMMSLYYPLGVICIPIFMIQKCFGRWGMTIYVKSCLTSWNPVQTKIENEAYWNGPGPLLLKWGRCCQKLVA